MKILNLYAGIGGNRAGWRKYDQNIFVTAVEHDPRIAEIYHDNFRQDVVVVGDAHQYLLDHSAEFDFIWSSPPCPTHSRMQIATRHQLKRYPDMSLYQEIIFLEHQFTGLYVVENVMPYYKPLMPAQQIGRHLFWSNFQITANAHHAPSGFITGDDPEAIRAMKDLVGIQYKGNVYVNGNHSPGQALRNCVLPELSRQVLESALFAGDDLFSSGAIA